MVFGPTGFLGGVFGVFGLKLGGFEVRHVAYGDDGVDHFPVGIVDRRAAIAADPLFAAIGSAGLHFVSGERFAAQGSGDGPLLDGEDVARCQVADFKQLGQFVQVSPGGLDAIHPVHGQCRRVHVQKVALGIKHHQPFGQAVQDGLLLCPVLLGQVFLLAQFFFDSLAVGDVLQHAEEFERDGRIGRAAEDDPAASGHPADFAVGANDAEVGAANGFLFRIKRARRL